MQYTSLSPDFAPEQGERVDVGDALPRGGHHGKQEKGLRKERSTRSTPST